MKAYQKRFLTFCLLALLFIMPVSYAGASDLDSLIDDKKQSEESDTGKKESGSDSSSKSNISEDMFKSSAANKDTIEKIHDATKIDDADGKADSVNTAVSNWVAPIIIVIAYVATALLALRVTIDILYIVIPFSIFRDFLDGGATSVPAGGGGGMQGGYGGYGRRGYGGYGGGMGVGGGGGAAIVKKNKWVSEEAIRAVMMTQPQQPQQQGGGFGGFGGFGGAGGMQGGQMTQEDNTPHPLKLYAKSMLLILVLTPILLALALSGVLVDFGFYLGELLVGGVENIPNMF